MINPLSDIEAWFRTQCNGEWEHTHGISIETLDNPGGGVKIDLKGTPWENNTFEEVNVDRTQDDWLHCKKDGAIFQGHGDPCKLELILSHFLRHVNPSEPQQN